MTPGFWDSSALVRLCIRQQRSSAADVLSLKYAKTVWWGTPVEIQSAIARLLRLGEITANGRVQAQIVLDRLRRGWTEIGPASPLREKAETFTDRFPLTAADALQLAAAWVWCSGSPRRRAFISSDLRLLGAARQLGFNGIET
jgi:predicted nucleic acid-binding protein